MKKLILAGIGIKYLSHMTVEVKAAIQESDCVIYLVNEPASKKWIEENSKRAVSLDSTYFSNTSRTATYTAIKNEITRISSLYETTCFVTYGHPFFLSSSAMSVANSLDKSDTKILVMPGISSLDCLYCDLQIDPGDGIQEYEATDFVVYQQTINTSVHLVLWQIGVVGIINIIKSDDEISTSRRTQVLMALKDKLLGLYGAEHPVYLYVASQYPSISPEIKKIELSQLADMDIDRLTTAYIPPASERIKDDRYYNSLFAAS